MNKEEFAVFVEEAMDAASWDFKNNAKPDAVGSRVVGADNRFCLFEHAIAWNGRLYKRAGQKLWAARDKGWLSSEYEVLLTFGELPHATNLTGK